MRSLSPRLAWVLPALLLASAAVAGEVGFVEDFALARDRSAALRQLIPGTEDYYFYHALHALQTEQYDQVTALTKPWLERFGQTPRLTEIQTRHALLAEDLRAPHPQDFGAYPIHRQMTLAQLDELLKLRPDLLNQAALVQAWVAKLQPGADEDWRHDPGLTRAYLDRLLGFVRRLAPAH